MSGFCSGNTWNFTELLCGFMLQPETQTPQGGSLWLFIQMEQGSPRGDVPSVCATASSQESWFSSTGPVFGPHVICPLMDF